MRATGFNDEGTFTPDDLYAGDFPVIRQKRTIASGAGVLVRGTVIGRITASGKYLKSIAAAVDGSEVPDEVLEEDIDATAADVEAVTARTGHFKAEKLTFGAGHTAASTRAGMRGKGIHY